MKRVAILTLLIATYLAVFPVIAYAATWVTPSGVVVNDAGQIVSLPLKLSTSTPARTIVTTNVLKHFKIKI